MTKDASSNRPPDLIRRLAALEPADDILSGLVALAASITDASRAGLVLAGDEGPGVLASHGREFAADDPAVATACRVVDHGATVPDASGSAGGFAATPVRVQQVPVAALFAVGAASLDQGIRQQLERLAGLAGRHLEQMLETRLLDQRLSEQERLTELVRERDHQLRRTIDLLNFHLDNSPLAMVELDESSRIRRWSPQAELLFGWRRDEVMGRALAELEIVHPDDLNDVIASLDELVTGETPRISRVNRNLTRSGEELVCEWYNSARFDHRGRLVSILSMATDVTRRYRAERQLQARARQQEAVARLGQRALAGETVESIAAEAVETLARVLAVDLTKVLRLQPGGEALDLIAGVGWDAGLVGRASVPNDSGSQAGYTLGSREPVVVPDLASEQRFTAPELLVNHGVVSGMSVMISGPDGPWGVLGIHHRAQREFDSEDVHFAQSAANILAGVVQRDAGLEELRHSEERYRHATEASQAALWDYDMTRDRIRYSDRFREMLGYSSRRDMPQTMGGYMELIHPEDRDHVVGLAEQLVRGSGADRASAEFRLRTADRGYRWFESNSKLVRDRHGNPVRRVGSTIDIHDRRVAEQRARENARHVRAVLDAAADAVVTAGESGVIESVNPAACRMFGHSEQALVGANLKKLIPAHQRDAHDRGMQHFLDSGEGPILGTTIETTGLHADGHEFPVDLTVTETRLGDRILFIGFIHDIADRKRAERALRSSEERFRTVARATTDVIWDLDVESGRVWWSEGLEMVFGWKLEEVGNEIAGWTVRIHPDDLRAVEASLVTAMEGDADSWSEEYRFRRASGEYARVIDNAYILRDDSGRARRMLGGINDITERRELEEQLRMAQRTEAMGQLTGGVAHDFNNLLTVILGNAELLVEHLESQPRYQRLAEMTRDAAQSGAELTQRLLAFARRQALDPEPTDIHALIQHMEPLLRRSLTEAIDLQVMHAEDLWPAEIDAGQLESALLNLALNARDAMSDGGRLTIETGNVHLDEEYCESQTDVAPGDYVMLAVSDTGTGIRPEHLPRLFEPFFTTKSKGKGTGLGLPMVYGFVKQSRGHVRVYSEPGEGTTVRLYLPRSTRGASGREPGRDPAADQRGSERILAVEDDDLVLEHAQRLLEQMGYRVVTAGNAAEALKVLENDSDFDLLFTDVIMPGEMKGPDLARVVRERIPGIAVLYTSGYTENAIVHHGRLDEGVSLLQKPYRRADLARKVRDVLDEHRGEPQP